MANRDQDQALSNIDNRVGVAGLALPTDSEQPLWLGSQTASDRIHDDMESLQLSHPDLRETQESRVQHYIQDIEFPFSDLPASRNDPRSFITLVDVVQFCNHTNNRWLISRPVVKQLLNLGPLIGFRQRRQCIKLDLGTSNPPGYNALQKVARWLHKQSGRTEEGQNHMLGPDNVRDMRDTDLIALYAAALAFRVKPCSAIQRLEEEIGRRLRQWGPDRRIFELIIRRIPTETKVVELLIQECYNNLAFYSKVNFDRLASFIQPREDLVRRFITYQDVPFPLAINGTMAGIIAPRLEQLSTFKPEQSQQ